MDDFLFEFTSTGKVQNSQLTQLSSELNKGHFVKQLNRLLRYQKGNRVISTGCGSNFPLSNILSGIGPENISMLSIYTRDDNAETVGRWFCVDIVLEEGVVSIQPEWTDYRESRFEELVSYMLMPIYKSGLWEVTKVEVPGWKEHFEFGGKHLPQDVQWAIEIFAQLKPNNYLEFITEDKLNYWCKLAS